MDIKWKNNSGKSILLVILCAALAGALMCNAYPYFRGRAEKLMDSAREEVEKAAEETKLFYVDEDFERYLLSSIYYMNYEITPDMDAYEYFTQNYDVEKFTGEEQSSIREASSRLMKNMRNQYMAVQSMYDYGSFAYGVEKNFGTNPYLENIIRGDNDEGKQYFQSGIVVSYDSRGVPSIKDSWNIEFDEVELLGYLQAASLSRLMEDNGMDSEYVIEDTGITYDEASVAYEEAAAYEDPVELAERNDNLLMQLPVPRIQNATFAFGIVQNNGDDSSWYDYWAERHAYGNSGYILGMFGIMGIMAILAVVLQNISVLGLRKNRLFCLPTELVILAGCMGVGLTFGVLYDFGIYTMTGRLVEDCSAMGFGEAASTAATVFLWLFWSCFAFCWYWLAASLLPYVTHPIRTLRERMLCISFCRWLKGLWIRIWHWATDIQLDENLTRNIWKAVGINGLIVMALCCIWFGGVVGAVIYSILLYVLVKKKCGEIQENYRKLLHVTRSIAEGDLNSPTDEDMGLFNPVRDELISIQSGFRKAVNEEVKSRNMKTELITNVSHDLKTPLTAIITYVDLLKKEDITEEERREYVDTLDRKSQRLKVLIEDLFEVSKATTDNITMNFEDVDLTNLIKQVRLENEDKIADSTLDFRWNLPEEKCILSLDPQRTFRIIDNLVQNILKYSMPHSRVYIDMRNKDGEVALSFKNMSEVEMNFSPEEITERFARGDLSRNTEGSGLGLAIAQSFTELQNGTFKVETDGDLFKVTITFKR